VSSSYDIIIVGAGLAAATYCAVLKKTHKILVLDIRNHIGGNCYDYVDQGTFIHQYGPHIFHSPNPCIVSFLSLYTNWKPADFYLDAEIERDGQTLVTPFPYRKTSSLSLSTGQVVDLYFRGYSEKMWGIEWDNLPNFIRNRVPKDSPEYYPNQFVGFPANGYTHMMENMFDGVEIRLKAGTEDWKRISAKTVIYTGRPDFIDSIPELHLDFRSLKIDFTKDTSNQQAVRNFCHLKVPYVRKTWYSRLLGGNSNLCSTEVPYLASYDDPTPYYPMQFLNNPERFGRLQKAIRGRYPNLILSGRLGTYKYLDMYQVVGQSLAFVKSHFNAISLL
jgi:UDP-galactopyranose mutase